MSYRSVFVVLIILILSSCSTAETRKAYLREWYGKDISFVIERWGAPVSQTEMPNGRIAYAFMQGNPTAFFCRTTFIIDLRNVVISATSDGTNCY